MSVRKGRGKPGWTAPSDLRAQVLRLWERGTFLSEVVSGESPFPLRLAFKVPTAGELGTRYDEARDWIASLTRESGYYRVAFEERRHHQLGTNSIPVQVWIDTRNDALAFIRKGREAAEFDRIVSETRERQPLLLPWLQRRSLRALELAAEWQRLLNTVEWLQKHPRPAIYLRQANIPDVDSKFIEQHRGVLTELLDLALPAAAVQQETTGISRFERRYGFLAKTPRIRFRMLDYNLRVFAEHVVRNAHVNAADDTRAEEDITVPLGLFAALRLPITRVFIIENEIDFLAFPLMTQSMVVFGAGYGVESLAAAAWLAHVDLYYWGDIDTHGFVILDALRRVLPEAKSFLMDHATLMAHRTVWGQEPKPATYDLPNLLTEEARLYDDLRTNRLGERLRLEQERISSPWLLEALQRAGLREG